MRNIKDAVTKSNATMISEKEFQPYECSLAKYNTK